MNVAPSHFFSVSHTLDGTAVAAHPDESGRIVAFDRLLNDPEHLSPQAMLLKQADVMASVVTVDLTAKVAGAFSQSVNKLTNMT